MTEIAAKFESMAAVDPDRRLCVVPVIVDKGSVVDSQLRNALAVDGESREDRESIRSAARHVCRCVQSKTGRLEILNRRVLKGSMAREVHPGVQHKIGSGRIVCIEIQLRSWGCIPASRTPYPVYAVIRIVLV